jgi:hypothetical protein
MPPQKRNIIKDPKNMWPQPHSQPRCHSSDRSTGVCARAGTDAITAGKAINAFVIFFFILHSIIGQSCPAPSSRAPMQVHVKSGPELI